MLVPARLVDRVLDLVDGAGPVPARPPPGDPVVRDAPTLDLEDEQAEVGVADEGINTRPPNQPHLQSRQTVLPASMLWGFWNRETLEVLVFCLETVECALATIAIILVVRPFHI